MMAKRLIDRQIKIDAFVSSPAKRAKKTAEIFAKEFDIKKEKIKFIEELYLASPQAFFDVISNLDDKYETVALFSHNDGITNFANQLTETRIDEIPTCGIFGVSIDIKSWKEFQEAEKSFWFYDAPKLG